MNTEASGDLSSPAVCEAHWRRLVAGYKRAALVVLCVAAGAAAGQPRSPVEAAITSDIEFSTHDGHPLYGRLTAPRDGRVRAVVVYVQPAEGMTIGAERPTRSPRSVACFGLYRALLPPSGMAFFCYEGRGIRTDPASGRETVDRRVYDTSSLTNKARDALAAAAVVRKQPKCRTAKVFLLGVSEGTLIAAEAAAREPKAVDGLVLRSVLAADAKAAIRYKLTEGDLRVLLRQFDADADGKITKAEYEADPKGYRKKTVLRSMHFKDLDVNGDGVLTAEDMAMAHKWLLDAAEKEDVALLDEWADWSDSTLPRDWFKDHFAHDPVWAYLEPLTIPVGLFHGDDDEACSPEAVRDLERGAAKAAKTNLRFEYFPGHDHAFNVEEYLASGRPTKGSQAIIDYIKGLAR